MMMKNEEEEDVIEYVRVNNEYKKLITMYDDEKTGGRKW